MAGSSQGSAGGRMRESRSDKATSVARISDRPTSFDYAPLLLEPFLATSEVSVDESFDEGWKLAL